MGRAAEKRNWAGETTIRQELIYFRQSPSFAEGLPGTRHIRVNNESSKPMDRYLTSREWRL
jgi:hypothetical protein